MTRPSVSQAQAWRPEALRVIAEAWDQAAGGLQIQLDELAREVLATGDFWTGSAADEARAKINDITAPGRQAARALIAAAAAARNGERRITEARDLVLAEVSEARALGYAVAEDGAVTAPATIPDPVRMVCGGDDTVARAMMQTRATEFTTALIAALEHLGEADHQTAGEIDAAFATGQPEPVATTPAGTWSMTAAEVVGGWPAMTQARIAEQIAAMSAEQREHLIETVPKQVGNTDGVPWTMRMAANRINVADAILYEQRTVGVPEEAKVRRMLSVASSLDPGSAERVWLAAHSDPVVRAAVVAAHDREANARIDFYQGLLTDVPDPTTGTEDRVPRQLIAFDPDRSALIELTGDLAAATSVGVLVPGLNTTIAGSAADVETSRRFVTAGGGDVAMITYLGGPFPTGDLAAGIVDAGKATYALEMAPRLAAFSEDVDRTFSAVEAATGRPVAVTYIGHSYGGSILGTAEQLRLTADRTFYVAAAGSGAGVDDPSDWHNRNPDVHRFAMTAPGDWIQAVQGLPISPHGADPDDMAGVVQVSTGRRLDGSLMAGPAAHSAVLNEPSDAWHNILAVITGDWAALRVTGASG